ncbi:MAG: cryptochrome/photolyase family protein [Pseudomonadota bacterium]|nr:cryptochrome/photolyase family protein [Pseudomonadota bacterium]
MAPPTIRHLVLVLGDQLDRDSAAFDGFDAACDAVWMCEAAEESTHVWSSKQRIAMFLAAMRHFAQALRDDAVPLQYQELVGGSLARALQRTLGAAAVQRVVLVEPGEWRLRDELQNTADAAGVPIEFREDRHFLCSSAQFEHHAKGRRQLRMEYFYREMRKRHQVLMESAADAKPNDETGPAGGQWNYDKENRKGFGVKGPGLLPPPLRFDPDALTQAVIDAVNDRFASHPGTLASFAWPVTREQALQALQDFIDARLSQFGHWQDAMWEGEPWLYHAQLSAALNLKLLNPREVIAAAQAAWKAGSAPLPAVEGFIRQILGWREYVRGVYWLSMPGYLQRNELKATADLPAWYWSGDVPMRCLADTITQTLQFGYAHHIQRLMVTGLYAMLHGVDPQQVHGWYLSVYVDAVEWVELPNTLGMSQYADGGVMGSKPYAATGLYIDRMSNHCGGCRFDPGERTGPSACPFTTLYWDFLSRHEKRFEAHPRMALQIKNLKRIDVAERQAIAMRAAAVRAGEWSNTGM